MRLREIPKTLKAKTPECRTETLHYRGVKVDVCKQQDRWRLYCLYSNNRGKGFAGRLLDSITATAAALNVPVYLNAGAYGEVGLEQDALIAFYERHGFVFHTKATNKYPTGVFGLPKPKEPSLEKWRPYPEFGTPIIYN